MKVCLSYRDDIRREPIYLDCDGDGYDTIMPLVLKEAFDSEKGHDYKYNDSKAVKFLMDSESEFIFRMVSFNDISGGEFNKVLESKKKAYTETEEYIRSAQMVLMLKSFFEQGFNVEIINERLGAI